VTGTMQQTESDLTRGVLFTDHYQLTMSQLYFREGLHEKRVRFDHYFREYPDYGTHQAGYCINAGMGSLQEWMNSVSFDRQVLDVLAQQRDVDGKALFDDGFLQYLHQMGGFEGLSITAIPEGRVVHPHESLTVVEGPLIKAQLLETVLLATLNYQTLIATRAARIKFSGRDQLMLDFGMRRGHAFGANAGTRAALIGGADYSSNVGVSQQMGLPARGTHAHSMVQVYMALGMGEFDAFRAYAKAYPNQCLLLVDTVDTLGSGVPNAIRVFEELRASGYEPVGVRLDSGDLAYLSIQVANLLDAAGFSQAGIALSNNLDEISIWQIVTQIQHEAGRYGQDASKLLKRLSFGVGTRLMTSEGASALGGVYKLVAVEDGSQWKSAIKLSESAVKTPSPGQKRVYRLYDSQGSASVDVIAEQDEGFDGREANQLFHPTHPGSSRRVKAGEMVEQEELLQPVAESSLPPGEALQQMRERRDKDISRLHPGVLRLVNPHIYHVSLSESLHQSKQRLVEDLKRGRDER
ncbi:MAG: nicotinate phosphoribosyltransferase, partial [Granulosicoccaceae bacterium]